MSTLKGRLARVSAAACLLCATALPARAGIPVYSAVEHQNSIMQFIQDAANQITQIGHQITQIEALQSTLNAQTGSRALGGLLRNGNFDNYVPLDAAQRIADAARRGYAGLTGPAKALRDNNTIFDCTLIEESRRAGCDRDTSVPWQDQVLIDGALAKSSERMVHINRLTDAISHTTDPAGKLEMIARLNAEQAMLQQEQTRALLWGQQVQARERIEQMQRRERTAAMLREGKSIADFYRGGVAP
ncbi:type IV secretion system protein [Azohydromonas aeria]|uniref:type IV secretion system protein n=1 Tax=Azohydromonas aeria TaxID=2590212 RepID=UPI0012FA4678|nr:type IV secretion system protein [Azohydromonas aeria]